jgi:hypothetical protein
MAQARLLGVLVDAGQLDALEQRNLAGHVAGDHVRRIQEPRAGLGHD